MAPLLSVSEVSLRFGGIIALDGVSFDIEAGQISGLIGPNGAGKTTAFNVITRLYPPDRGRLELDGVSLLQTPAHRIVERGIARTFQSVNLFRSMSVLENVIVSAEARRRGARVIDARAMLDYVGLGARADQSVAELSFPLQKRVELARALAAGPRLLLLDEPAGGLDHSEVQELGDLIVRARADYELTILLVEHHMNLVMDISDHVIVLSSGRTIAAGTPSEVRVDPGVIEAYLGRDGDA